jgi:hypothetical protein
MALESGEVANREQAFVCGRRVGCYLQLAEMSWLGPAPPLQRQVYRTADRLSPVVPLDAWHKVDE